MVLCFVFQADEERRRVIEESKQCGPSAAAEALSLADPSDTGQCSEVQLCVYRSASSNGHLSSGYAPCTAMGLCMCMVTSRGRSIARYVVWSFVSGYLSVGLSVCPFLKRVSGS